MASQGSVLDIHSTDVQRSENNTDYLRHCHRTMLAMVAVEVEMYIISWAHVGIFLAASFDLAEHFFKLIWPILYQRVLDMQVSAIVIGSTVIEQRAVEVIDFFILCTPIEAARVTIVRLNICTSESPD